MSSVYNAAIAGNREKEKMGFEKEVSLRNDGNRHDNRIEIREIKYVLVSVDRWMYVR